MIVRRDDVSLCHRLRQQFADDPGVEVIADRRIGERRTTNVPHELERRRTERRLSQHSLADTLRSVGWAAIVRSGS